MPPKKAASTKPLFRFDLRFFAIVLLVCAGLLPIALMSHHVRANWVSVPTWDEWHTPGATFEQWCAGTLTIGDLFMQHNESRKFFPRLLYLTLVQFGGWDVRKEMVCIFLEVCFLSALLLRLLRRTKGSTTVSVLITWSIMMFLCFSPVQFQNFVYGIQLEPFFPGVALVAIALVNLSGLSFRSKTLVNLTLAFAATYTFANGMLLWLLGFPISASADSTTRRQRTRWYVLYIICGALSIGCYFVGYKRPAGHPVFASLNGNSLALAHYLILWIGAYFASDYVSPFIFGILALVFAALVSALVLNSIVRNKDWRTFYPWLLIGSYSLLTEIVTALGRIRMEKEQALSSRYTVFSLFFYLALVGSVFAFYCTRIRSAKPALRSFFLTNVGWLVGLMALAWLACYPTNLAALRSHRSDQARLRRTLQWVNIIPDNPDLSLIFPFVDVLRNRVHLFTRCGLLKLRFIKEPLASQVKQSPATATGSNGQIENCEFDSAHSLVISGWAWLPARNQRADCVVIGCRDISGKFKPLTVFGTAVPRPDLRDRFHLPNIYHAGFSRTLEPGDLFTGEVAIEGWAIDLKEQKAFPLASSLTVHNEGQ